nr:MAG TPA: hypothetical protein [Microviridae sp.]
MVVIVIILNILISFGMCYGYCGFSFDSQRL